ncbi:MAG: hypothetical protein JXR83_18310 [Deltaproteobacteria bacterium]|nr:hypothetical protein [Deltaproteobacteria bacterium]
MADDFSAPEPLGPRQRSGRVSERPAASPRPDGNRTLKGCLIALAVMLALIVAALATCTYLARRSFVDDPGEAAELAQAMADFALPEGYAAQGAMRIPWLGRVVFFGLPGEESARAPAGHEVLLARFDVELSEKQALDALTEASGQNSGGSEFKSVRCSVDGRPAACIDGEGVAEQDRPGSGATDQGERWRYQAVLVVVGKDDVFVAAVFGGAEHFDPAFAEAFFDSLRIKPK